MRAFGILFMQHGNAGWSEVYPMTVADYAAAATALGAIFGARRTMAMDDVILVGARISDSDVKGDSYPAGLTIGAPGTYAPASGELTFNPQYALRCLANAGTLKRGSRWIRGIPSKNIAADGEYIPTTAFETAIAAYFAALLAHCSIATKLAGAVVAPFYTFTALTAIDWVAMERRSVGRPFGQPVGRR